MKATIHNLGIVKDAVIDIKPLTVLIGPNNAGKTWLAYTLSAILGRYGWSRYVEAYIEGKVEDRYPLLEQAEEQIVNQGNAAINMVEFIDKYGEIFVNNVAKLAREWMPTYMSTSRVSFAELEVQILLEEWLEKLKNYALAYTYTRRLSIGKKREKPLLIAEKEAGQLDLSIYTSSAENSIENLPSKATREIIAYGAFHLFREVLFSDTPIFPTERTTFITFPLQSVRAKDLEVLESREQRGQLPKPLIGPIGAFLTMMITTSAITQDIQKERETHAEKDDRVATYIKAAEIVEQQILEGDVGFSALDFDSSRVLLFRPGEGINIDISLSSSMVKELTALVLYLRYLAEPADWVIIDEPEMNLHPEAQVKLTELLAMLVSAGLRVCITTHSPYIVDHLANLLKAAQATDKEAISGKFFLKQVSSFLPREEVAVYEVQKGKIRPILEDDGIIDWKTFSDVSDRVMQIYFEL